MYRLRVPAALTFAAGIALLWVAEAQAVGPNVRGRVSGQDKLSPDVYVEAAKTDAHRWTWREPSPAVDSKYRNLAANPSRDICIAALSTGGGAPTDSPMLMSLTGGRIFPTTIVVAPGQKLQFKNFDPFDHRIYMVGNPSLKAEKQSGGGVREWQAPTGGEGKFEIRDELFPSVRTWVIVNPQVVQITYPGRDGAFAFSLGNGDYILKAFFNGKQVGPGLAAAAREKGAPNDLKQPLDVGDGAGAQ
jgi:hypothetical protein